MLNLWIQFCKFFSCKNLLNKITSSGSNIEGLNISEKLSEDAKTNILAEINKLDPTDPAKAKLMALFGMVA